jgi:hypothetical protein
MEGHAPVWAEPLRREMLSAHMLHACAVAPPASAPPADAAGAGELLYHQLVAKYAAKRALGSRVFVTAPPGVGGRTGEVVLIDNRANVWSVMSLLVTLDNLRLPDWSVTVFCGDANVEFMRACVLPHVPHARIETLPEMSVQAGGQYDIESYNRLLKTALFWRRLRSERALLVQDDGLLMRSGLDDDAEMLAQAFVGAPWLDQPDNRKMLQSAGVGDGLVGNGGLSLRNVAAMVAWCDNYAGTLGARLFNADMQPMPEDVFFAAAAARSGRACPLAVAERFAFEEAPPKAGVRPLGFHKPWPYLSRPVLVDAFESFLESFLFS